MHLLGIDVGTGSARAGVFDASGRQLGAAGREIRTWRPHPGWAQQSSADIWASVCSAVREAVEKAGVAADSIAGIGFDATCSLVVSDENNSAISVDPAGAPDQDIIVWMDHRAISDAGEINRIGGEPLKYVGGTISPEMQMPKLRWLSREMPQAFAKAANLRDLPDWLVWRASGSDARSLCSLVCKWTYLGHLGDAGEGWDDAFFSAIGLGALTGADGHARIGRKIVAPGRNVGALTPEAASELGLRPGTSVAASLIDAYSGALGTLGVGQGTRLAMIAGTSTCHIVVTEEAAFVPGVWGPYQGALLPGLWANEGGQSAAGALLDAVLARHGAYAALASEAEEKGLRPTQLLEETLAAMSDETATLTVSRHIQPDAHGNRSPLAEPWRKGGVDGITLDTGREDLALDYLATIQALAYGTRHILEALRGEGVIVDAIVPSGGLAKNALFLRETADACSCPVVVPDVAEPVLLGSAILGAVAAGTHPDLDVAMTAMAPAAREIAPRGGAIAAYHDRKYRVFRRMQQDHAAYRQIMELE